MSAKHKLNAAYVQGILLVAGLMGLLTNSGTVFLLTAATLFATSWHTGEIRSR